MIWIVVACVLLVVSIAVASKIHTLSKQAKLQAVPPEGKPADPPKPGTPPVNPPEKHEPEKKHHWWHRRKK